MENSTRFLEVVISLAGAGVLAFAMYRAHRREHLRRIQAWIRDYLSLNYDRFIPATLRINCSDDPLWPVIVRFDELPTNTRRCLKFACAGEPTSFRLLSAVDETGL